MYGASRPERFVSLGRVTSVRKRSPVRDPGLPSLLEMRCAVGEFGPALHSAVCGAFALPAIRGLP